MTDKHYSGSCMCGEVRFTWRGAPRFVAECVCESCRRAHGASVVAWLGGQASQFNVEQGESRLRWYESSADTERGFCDSCGTRLLFRSSRWPGEMHLALACMDEPHDLVSQGLVFENELPAWTAVAPKHHE